MWVCLLIARRHKSLIRGCGCLFEATHCLRCDFEKRQGFFVCTALARLLLNLKRNCKYCVYIFQFLVLLHMWTKNIVYFWFIFTSCNWHANKCLFLPPYSYRSSRTGCCITPQGVTTCGTVFLEGFSPCLSTPRTWENSPSTMLSWVSNLSMSMLPNTKDHIHRVSPWSWWIKLEVLLFCDLLLTSFSPLKG